MIKKLRRWYGGLRYPVKIAVHLMVLSLWAFCLWARAGYPLPTTEMEFRRIERQNLLPKSEIVLLSKRKEDVFPTENGPDLVINDRWAVGRRQDTAVVAALGDQRPWYIMEIPLEPSGATVVPLTYRVFMTGRGGYWVEETSGPGWLNYHHHNFDPYLVLDVPAETQRIEMHAENHEGVEFFGTGWKWKDDMWIVGLANEEALSPLYDDSEYELRLYAADGSILLSRVGRLSYS